MYLTIGETKLRVGQYGEGTAAKLEISFEYAFVSHNSYRRFAQVIADRDRVKIKLKSEFMLVQDCIKLSQLILGVEKLISPDNLDLLRAILKPDSTIEPAEFITQQTDLIEYFK